MPHIMLDANFLDSDEALDLCEQLRNSYASLHVIKLWLFYMGAHCADGVITITAERLKLRSGYPGDAQEFLDAMLKTRFLVPQDRSETYYMRGWSRNDGYFKFKTHRATYMRDRRADAKLAAETSNSDVTVTSQHTCPYILSDLIEDKMIYADAFPEVAKSLGLPFNQARTRAAQEPLLSLYPLTRAEILSAWETTQQKARKPNLHYFVKTLASQRDSDVTVTRNRTRSTKASPRKQKPTAIAEVASEVREDLSDAARAMLRAVYEGRSDVGGGSENGVAGH